MGPRVLGETQSHAAARTPSTRLSHSAIWFQLVKIWLTSLRSRASRRLSAGAVAKRRAGGFPPLANETPAGKPPSMLHPHQRATVEAPAI